MLLQRYYNLRFNSVCFVFTNVQYVCVCVYSLRYMFTNIYTPTDETNENFTISHPSMSVRQNNHIIITMLYRYAYFVYCIIYTYRNLTYAIFAYTVKQN